jgi:hypothetical protein
MTTISLGRAETRSISIAAPPGSVLQLLAEPRNLPAWAPAFAQAVAPADPDWLINPGPGQFRIRVHVSAELGTVDLLDPRDLARGAHMRVLSNGDGSELLFTLVFPTTADEESIGLQMATVEAELRAVRDLCGAQTA